MTTKYETLKRMKCDGCESVKTMGMEADVNERVTYCRKCDTGTLWIVENENSPRMVAFNGTKSSIASMSDEDLIADMEWQNKTFSSLSSSYAKEMLKRFKKLLERDAIADSILEKANIIKSDIDKKRDDVISEALLGRQDNRSGRWTVNGKHYFFSTCPVVEGFLIGEKDPSDRHSGSIYRMLGIRTAKWDMSDSDYRQVIIDYFKGRGVEEKDFEQCHNSALASAMRFKEIINKALNDDK